MEVRSNSQIVNSQRLYSLDALRGFDMLWIMGLGPVVKDITESSTSPFWMAVAEQFEHRIWNGFTFWDLIFPLFMFLAGVSTPYSIDRDLEKGKTRRQLLVKIIRRGLLLIVLGIIYNNGLQIRPVSDIRFPSVLGKIGATYMLANIIYVYTREKIQWVWFGGLLTGYWLLLKFTSAPGYPTGDLTEPGNFMSYFDRSVLPGKLSKGIHDTVGLLCTIPGISTVLLGIFAGRFLKSTVIAKADKTKWLVIAGIISIALSFCWNIDFPFNKNLWSSSFVLLTGGLSLLLLAIFYYIIDVVGYRKWSLFFRVIGMNSILIYLSPVIINWDAIAGKLFKWLGQLFNVPYNKIVLALAAIFVQWLFLYFLYKKKTFFRV